MACKQIHRFRKNRFTDEKGGLDLFDTRGDPAMVSFRTIEKGDKRPRINDCGHLGRSL